MALRGICSSPQVVDAITKNDAPFDWDALWARRR